MSVPNPKTMCLYDRTVELMEQYRRADAAVLAAHVDVVRAMHHMRPGACIRTCEDTEWLQMNVAQYEEWWWAGVFEDRAGRPVHMVTSTAGVTLAFQTVHTHGSRRVDTQEFLLGAARTDDREICACYWSYEARMASIPSSIRAALLPFVTEFTRLAYLNKLLTHYRKAPCPYDPRKGAASPPPP